MLVIVLVELYYYQFIYTDVNTDIDTHGGGQTIQDVNVFTIGSKYIRHLSSNKICTLYRLGEDYQMIADKALTLPTNTAELMQLIDYVRVVECENVFEMEDRLEEVMGYMLFLSDYTIISAIEMKQNSLTFQWYNKMASVLEENRRIVEEKTLEFQQSLKVSDKVFYEVLLLRYTVKHLTNFSHCELIL